jgi:hypothetical protein
MRASVELDDGLVRIAQELTGIADITALLRKALEVLIELECARRLALLSCTKPPLKRTPSRRSTR